MWAPSIAVQRQKSLLQAAAKQAQANSSSSRFPPLQFAQSAAAGSLVPHAELLQSPDAVQSFKRQMCKVRQLLVVEKGPARIL